MQDSDHKILNFISYGDKNALFRSQNKTTCYQNEISIEEYVPVERLVDRNAFFLFDDPSDYSTSNGSFQDDQL